MKRASLLLLVGSAIVTGAAALGSTSVTGIPGNCQMTCHRVKVDPAGKQVGEPASFAESRMIGMWTPRAFRRSWDGKVVLAHTFDGFRVTKGDASADYKIKFLHRNFWWGPDNKKFLFWLPADVAVALVDELGPAGAAPKHNVVYKPAPGRFPKGIAWAPSGSHILVSEGYEGEDKSTRTAIKKVPVDGGEGTAILDVAEEVIFFMPADTWYEDGSGAKAKKSPILYGTKTELYITDSDGGDKQKLADLPCLGLADIMFDPSGKDEFFLLWRRGFADINKKMWKGLWRFDLAALRKVAAAKTAGDYSYAEAVSETDGIHTLFYSPKGKYIAWADPAAVFYREVAKHGEKPVKVEISGSAGVAKGLAWDDKEQKLAVAIGNKLYSYDVASKASQVIAQVSDKGFIAEPFWRGDEVVYSSFVNQDEKKKIDPPATPPK